MTASLLCTQCGEFAAVAAFCLHSWDQWLLCDLLPFFLRTMRRSCFLLLTFLGSVAPALVTLPPCLLQLGPCAKLHQARRKAQLLSHGQCCLGLLLSLDLKGRCLRKAVWPAALT